MYKRTPGQRLPSRHNDGVDHSKLASGVSSKGKSTKINFGSSSSKGHYGMFLFFKNIARRRKFLNKKVGTVAKATTFLLVLFAVCRSSYFRLQNRIPLMNSAKSPVKQVKSAMSPFDSHPPKTVSLNVTGNLRHACIEEIRNSRHSFFMTKIQNSTHILLVDPAYHSNVGDHMITIAELSLLENHRSQPTTNSLSQCSYVQAHDFVPSCDFILKTEVNHPNQIIKTYNTSSFTNIRNIDPAFHHTKVALWHGGGNFGNLWYTAQQARIRSIVQLLQANYTIIGMPNSWYYTNSQMEANDMQQLRTNIILGLGLDGSSVDLITDLKLTDVVKSRIVLTWREHFSYERAMLLLPFCTHQLVPDIAFQLGPYAPMRPTLQTRAEIPQQKQQYETANTIGITDIVFLLRNDHESIYSSLRNRQSMQHVLDSIPGASQLSFSIVDWDDRLLRLQPDNPNDVYFTDTAIKLLSMGRVLICDRLHSAILAYISDLSFIYLDQISGKIFKTITVAMESGSKCHRSSIEYDEAMSIQKSKLNKHVDYSKNLWTHAEGLSDAVEKVVQILRLQTKDSLVIVGQQQRSRTRELRRNQIRKNFSAG